MSTTLPINFETRPVIPLAHNYSHGESEPWHQHRCAQLLYSLSGVVSVHTAQGCWIIPPSRGVWLPAGVVHQLTITGQVAARTLFVDPFARADLPTVCQVVQVSPLLRELIIAALDLPDCYAPNSRAERVYELILDEIRVMSVLPFNLPEPVSSALKHLCMLVRDDLAKPWTTSEAATLINLSERTLLRHFRQEIGFSFSEWVRRAKLMEAIKRLAQGQSVLRVALDLGYESQSAFSTMFRRRLGMPPSHYFHLS
ncbi:AraC family transcriptional regulator [Rosenbergiella nectarea]|uniref:AraC family transcriptional regulator n=1 Tax=Rosenbergiella nectarea TaxID=988801 RepID=UPI001BDB3BC1|nr:helix-turn-helix transcriptional regulator [Rosenbergiella nectarea]MBT0731399.1 AraC family transcriptional regulator [Rosenbergiella nectarea subsp. apis]